MRQLNSPIDSSSIRSSFTCLDDPFANFLVHSVGPLNELSDGVLTFSLAGLGNVEHACFMIGPEDSEICTQTFRVSHPRFSFIKALMFILEQVGLEDLQTEHIHESVKFGKHVAMGKGVQIGEGTTIGHNVTIGDFVTIGQQCNIKSGAIIGDDGFNFERDESDLPIRFPHIGSVTIGNHVEVGSCSTVNKGALSETTVHDHVKIDDHVHIAHNVVINAGTLLTAGAIVGGSVTIGSDCWIGLNSSMYHKIKVGNRSMIGIGSCVLKDVHEESTMFGYAAKRLPKL